MFSENWLCFNLWRMNIFKLYFKIIHVWNRRKKKFIILLTWCCQTCVISIERKHRENTHYWIPQRVQKHKNGIYSSVFLILFQHTCKRTSRHYISRSKIVEVKYKYKYELKWIFESIIMRYGMIDKIVLVIYNKNCRKITCVRNSMPCIKSFLNCMSHLLKNIFQIHLYILIFCYETYVYWWSIFSPEKYKHTIMCVLLQFHVFLHFTSLTFLYKKTKITLEFSKHNNKLNYNKIYLYGYTP